jgi:hypothetical protein
MPLHPAECCVDSNAISSQESEGGVQDWILYLNVWVESVGIMKQQKL